MKSLTSLAAFSRTPISQAHNARLSICRHKRSRRSNCVIVKGWWHQWHLSTDMMRPKTRGVKKIAEPKRRRKGKVLRGFAISGFPLIVGYRVKGRRGSYSSCIQENNKRFWFLEEAFVLSLSGAITLYQVGGEEIILDRELFYAKLKQATFGGVPWHYVIGFAFLNSSHQITVSATTFRDQRAKHLLDACLRYENADLQHKTPAITNSSPLISAAVRELYSDEHPPYWLYSRENSFSGWLIDTQNDPVESIGTILRLMKLSLSSAGMIVCSMGGSCSVLVVHQRLRRSVSLLRRHGYS